MARLSVAVCITMLVSCSNPTAPAANVVSKLMIVTRASVLKVGDHESFAAALVSQQMSLPVNAAWATSNDTIITVDSGGLTTARSIGTAVLTASYNGDSVSRTIGVVADATGTWSGQFTITQCLHITGSPPGACRFFVNSTNSLTLILQQTRGELTGTLELFRSFPMVGAVTGTVTPDGGLVITGNLANTLSEQGSIDSWRSTINAASRTVEGHFVVTHTFGNFDGPQVERWISDFRSTSVSAIVSGR